jgi:hypothetical protein
MDEDDGNGPLRVMVPQISAAADDRDVYAYIDSKFLAFRLLRRVPLAPHFPRRQLMSPRGHVEEDSARNSGLIPSGRLS